MTDQTVSSRPRLAWLLGALCAACGARTAMLSDEAEPLTPDATVDAAPPDAGRDAPFDAPKDAPPDVRDAGPETSCDACVRMLVDDDTGFYELDAPQGTLQKVNGDLIAYFADIALSPDKKTLYGAGSAGIAIIDMTTWKITGQLAMPETNALEVGQDGTFYAAEWDTLYVRTPDGVTSTLGKFPDGLHSSGDLAFAGGRLYATAFATAYDALVEVDLPAGTTRVVGHTQARCIFGLVGADPAPLLYGVTCTGDLVQIDVATADTKTLAAFGAAHDFLGATRLADTP